MAQARQRRLRPGLRGGGVLPGCVGQPGPEPDGGTMRCHLSGARASQATEAWRHFPLAGMTSASMSPPLSTSMPAKTLSTSSGE